MAVFQRTEDPEAVVDGPVNGDVVRPDEVADGLALNELHHDVGHPDVFRRPVGNQVFAGVIDGDDGRVVQGGNGLGLALEPRLELGIPCQVRPQQLDGDGPPQPGVHTAVHVRHAATANQAAQFVAAAQDTLVIHREAVLTVQRCAR
jgi:hypothetical protein